MRGGGEEEGETTRKGEREKGRGEERRKKREERRERKERRERRGEKGEERKKMTSEEADRALVIVILVVVYTDRLPPDSVINVESSHGRIERMVTQALEDCHLQLQCKLVILDRLELVQPTDGRAAQELVADLTDRLHHYFGRVSTLLIILFPSHLVELRGIGHNVQQQIPQEQWPCYGVE
jgi:hypothetical protein